ncbi:MAG: hypothetical protein F2934_08020 [Actinobacteria bacterium]|uniref:Unannotated protein n=1 Tax=freshwater metagenome TaxID=449393 RepID=A0A6J6UZI0_9ZZZZ|nr:hypothetical protein [Actinomycetota bacterium]MSX21759.1 hypothetical protein [Actinomycetota bacterium]MSX80556.1 hypothetical protein [Actinomycetota bacterium]MSY13261.1 hypothetical protein [Actinomycetota bacterium]MSZ04691.1 hypothetical protein [Actinomycetota bacterium]
MSDIEQIWTYYATRFLASRDTDRDRGEISATTVALAALLVLAAIAVGGIIRAKVTAKANSIEL